MKELEEDNEAEKMNNNKENEKKSENDAETFNASFGEDLENQIQEKNNIWKYYIMIILFIIIVIAIIIFLQFKMESKNIIECQPGYYLPEDDTNQKICQKCSVENCNKCHGTKLSNVCTTCNQFLTPIYENGKIILCKYTCETGDDEMCKTCDKTRNECSSCNLGYKLLNGKCVVNYSFKAIYLSEYSNEKIKIINKLNGDIIEMIVDDTILSEPSKTYTFPTKGNHTIYFLIDLTKLDSLKSMFKEIKKITSISFTDIFDTKNIKDMSEMFYYNTLLTSIELSNFDTA